MQLEDLLFYFSIYSQKTLCLTLLEMLQCLTIDNRNTVGTLPACYVDQTKTRFYVLRVVICPRGIPQIEVNLHITKSPAALVVQGFQKVIIWEN